MEQKVYEFRAKPTNNLSIQHFPTNFGSFWVSYSNRKFVQNLFGENTLFLNYSRVISMLSRKIYPYILHILGRAICHDQFA